jgi:hypothetical protein
MGRPFFLVALAGDQAEQLETVRAALGHKTTRGQKLTRLVSFWPLVAVLTREIGALQLSLFSE